MRKQKDKGTVLCVCAHSDDQIFGPGGTLAKYAKEGKKIITIILSYGEGSHPHFKEDVIIKIRVEEAAEADKVIGGSGVIFLGMKEGRFKNEAEQKYIIPRLATLFKQYNPEKIFTHAIDDPHLDHQAVYKITSNAVKSMNYKGDVYSFEVWNPLNLMKRNLPKMYVDISKTFPLKIKALQCFQSQKMFILMLLPAVYSRAITAGLNANCRFAEVFYKIK